MNSSFITRSFRKKLFSEIRPSPPAHLTHAQHGQRVDECLDIKCHPEPPRRTAVPTGLMTAKMCKNYKRISRNRV